MTRYLPVIIISAAAVKPTVLPAETGADDYLAKPFSVRSWWRA
jgi:DNA-binding response OmpR family regulator